MAETLKKRVAESEAGIAAAVNEAVQSIRDVAAEVAIAATERLAGEAPGGDDATRAVDAVIKARG